jgi:hypothetical protein
MENLLKRFEDNYLLGCIKYHDQYTLYLMPIAWWILNYKKYDPEYSSKRKSVSYESGYGPSKPEPIFRDNILNVSDGEIEAYLDSIKEDKLSIKDLELIINVPTDFRYLHFFIDFDCKIFINGFFDIAVEDYLPDQIWKGEAGEPVSYLPSELKKTIEPWLSENIGYE